MFSKKNDYVAVGKCVDRDLASTSSHRGYGGTYRQMNKQLRFCGDSAKTRAVVGESPLLATPRGYGKRIRGPQKLCMYNALLCPETCMRNCTLLRLAAKY